MTSEPCSDEPRYRFSVAPRFACAPRWPDRLSRCGGVTRAGDRYEPRSEFTALDAADLEGFVAATPSGANAVLPPTLLGLMEIPQRLRTLFWSEAGKRGGAGMDRLFAGLDEFLRFKGLPLPPRAAFEVCVSAAGLPSTRRDASGAPAGLGFGAQPLGLLNLGDETSSVVLLPLPPATLARRLQREGEAAPAALGPEALARRFFERLPDEPVLCIRLEPGEGLWLSPFGVVHDVPTLGKRDLDVVLCIADGGA